MGHIAARIFLKKPKKIHKLTTALLTLNITSSVFVIEAQYGKNWELVASALIRLIVYLFFTLWFIYEDCVKSYHNNLTSAFCFSCCNCVFVCAEIASHILMLLNLHPLLDELKGLVYLITGLAFTVIGIGYFYIMICKTGESGNLFFKLEEEMSATEPGQHKNLGSSMDQSRLRMSSLRANMRSDDEVSLLANAVGDF